MSRSRSILARLVVQVGGALAVFSVVTGVVVFMLAYNSEIKHANDTERQLVRVVQAQAEVAVYAANVRIAEDVIEGLRSSPAIRAARISGKAPGAMNVGTVNASDPHEVVTEYPLYSPIDGKDIVGLLVVARNEPLVRAEAVLSAMQQTVLLLLQVLATTALLYFFFRRIIGRPLGRFARDVARIAPGGGERLQIPPEHEFDEIGALSQQVNTLLAQAEAALSEAQELAVTDSLTGLPNRRAFMQQINNELERIKRYDTPTASVLMLDLDHFKLVNDDHGHATGDAVLVEFGNVLRAEMRKVDFAGRIGGEEFALLLPGTTLEAAQTTAERLRERVAQCVVLYEGKTVRFTTSIGIAELTPGDMRTDIALARADAALYEAKHAGRNCVRTH